MRDAEFYERSVGLKEPSKVKEVKMGIEGRIEVKVECAERMIWASPQSRETLQIHGWERRSWRHLNTTVVTVITVQVPGSRARGEPCRAGSSPPRCPSFVRW